jgi:RHS repeat-associated protein
LINRSGVNGKTLTEGLSATANTKNQLAGFGYDIAGNMVSNGSASYTYDAENRVIAAAGWTYVYDGDGHRVKKFSGSTGTLYWPDLSGNTLNESSLGATNLHEYVYFGGKRVARIDVPTPLTVKYYYSDQLGSADVITDATGNILEESDYFPYGGEIAITNNDSNNYKFTGKERDSESGLDMFGARYYGSSLGRFMTPDWAAKPITVPYANFGNPQSLNLYSYVRNNPLSRFDPDGHCADHYKDGSCKVNVDPKTGDAGVKAGKQLEGVLNKYDKAVNGLGNKAKFDIKDSKGNVIGSMTGKEIKAVWNGTHFSITDKSFNNGGAGGGTGGSWKLFGGFSGKSELNPEAVSRYANNATGRNEAPLVGLSTLTFHELSHETHFGEALTGKYPVSDTLSPEREAGTSSAGRTMSGTVDAPFDCSIAGGCQ